MKRMLMVLTVALVLAAMLVATAAPAFAACETFGANDEFKSCFNTNESDVNPQSNSAFQIHTNRVP